MFKGFDPTSEEEKQEIDTDLNRLAYDTLRSIFVDGPERMGLKTPTAIQEYIVKKLLSIVLETSIGAAVGTIPGAKEFQTLARKIFSSDQTPDAYRKSAASGTASWLVNSYESLTSTIYGYTAGPIAGVPVRLMSAFLTHENGANIGRHLRLLIAGFADQLAEARPHFARSWQDKIPKVKRHVILTRRDRERDRARLNAIEGRDTLEDRIAQAQTRIGDARAVAIVMPEGFAEAEVEAAAAKTALEREIAEAERIIRETSTGVTGYFTYAASRISRAILDTPEVAEARSNLQTAEGRVAELQAEAQAAKQAHIAEQQAALEVLLAEQKDVLKLEENISDKKTKVENLLLTARGYAVNADLFRGGDILSPGMERMGWYIRAKVNSENDNIFRQDRAYFEALLAAGAGGKSAIDTIAGIPLETLGPIAYAEARDTLGFVAGELTRHYNEIGTDVADTASYVSKFASGQGNTSHALRLIEKSLKAGMEASQTMRGENPRAKEMYDGIMGRTAKTRAATTSLYETVAYIRDTSQASIQAFTMTGLVYAATYLGDAFYWDEMGTDEGILGYMDEQRRSAMGHPAELLGISPSILYPTLPVIGSATMFLASSPELRGIAAKTAVVTAPLAALWFAPTLVPAAVVVSVMSLGKWETSTRVTTKWAEAFCYIKVMFSSAFPEFHQQYQSLNKRLEHHPNLQGHQSTLIKFQHFFHQQQLSFAVSM